MPRATYTLELELSYNTWAAVTADWHTESPLVIERGLSPGERVAGIGRMTLALHNPDGRYTPGHANCTAGFRAGIGVRLKASDGANTYTLFTGRIAEVRPLIAAGLKPAPAEIVCEDDMAFLYRRRVSAFPLMRSVTPRQIVNWLIDSSFTPPTLFGYWRLDHPVKGLLGQTTTLPGQFTGKDFEAGQSVFPWAGDTWRGGRIAADLIADVCASEGGFLYIAVDGTPVFEGRHARPRHTVADAALSTGLAGLEASHERRIMANRVEVTYWPRESDTVESVLWSASKSIQLAPGVPRLLTVRYVDPDQLAEIVGAQDVKWPEKWQDFTATDQQDGAGTDATSYVSVGGVLGATSAQLVLVSRWPKNEMIYVHTLQLRGKPLRSFQPSTLVVEDAAALLADGRLPLAVHMPLQDDPRVAADMARALLIHRKDSHAWPAVRVEATASSALLTHALARDVGDRLAITDSAMALSAYGCFIEHIRHEIVRGGGGHTVIWRTSPADLFAYWIVGQSGFANLGQSTTLGY